MEQKLAKTLTWKGNTLDYQIWGTSSSSFFHCLLRTCLDGWNENCLNLILGKNTLDYTCFPSDWNASNYNPNVCLDDKLALSQGVNHN